MVKDEGHIGTGLTEKKLQSPNKEQIYQKTCSINQDLNLITSKDRPDASNKSHKDPNEVSR